MESNDNSHLCACIYSVQGSMLRVVLCVECEHVQNKCTDPGAYIHTHAYIQYRSIITSFFLA